MNESLVTVPLRYDESAFPLGTVTFSQFAVAETSVRTDYQYVKVTDDQVYESVPMVLSDHSEDRY